jgi:SAM-dependent methyltransferase
MNKEAYQQYVGEADNWLHRGRRLLLENCLTLLFPTSAATDKTLRILEIGAGSGRTAEVLSRFGVVDAVEIEPIAIDILKNSRHVRRLFTRTVPFPSDERYDLICAMDVLEHVQDDKQVFQWMVDHLDPEGKLFLTVPAYQFLFSYHDVALGHYRRYRLEQLVALNDRGLSLLKKGYFNFVLFPLIAASRLLGRMTPGGDGSQKKQSSAVSPSLDRLFFSILRTEANLIRKYRLFPYGLTAFALLKNCRPDDAPGRHSATLQGSR